MNYKSSTIYKKKESPTTFKKIGYELLISTIIGAAIGIALGFLLLPSPLELIRMVS